MTISSFASSLLVPLAIGGCVASGSGAGADGGDDDSSGDDKADGTSTSGTYFECSGLATSNTVWLDVGKTSVTATIEGVGVNTGKLTTSSSSSKTYSSWSSKVFFGAMDTLVIPDSLISSGSGKVQWNVADVNPYWEGTCTKKAPSGDQCLPLVDQIDPVDSSAKATYTTTSAGHYTVDIPSSTVGDFVYAVTMKTSGILCTEGTTTAKSCSALVADKIGTKAIDDGSSSGQPYVSKRTKTSGGYSWAGGVHDAESGEFAYVVTTSSDADGCTITGITSSE